MNGHPSDDAFGGVGEHATPRREDPRRPSDASADYSRASSSSTRDCPSDDDDAEDAFGGAGGDDLDSPAAWFDAQDSVREFDDLAHGIKVGLRGKSEGLPLLRATQMLLEGRYDSGFEAAADNSDGATRDVARIRARIASLTPSETYPSARQRLHRNVGRRKGSLPDRSRGATRIPGTWSRTGSSSTAPAAGAPGAWPPSRGGASCSAFRGRACRCPQTWRSSAHACAPTPPRRRAMRSCSSSLSRTGTTRWPASSPSKSNNSRPQAPKR
ncbi:hypothetical protein M885DRAFT_512959 [Pelagophyceae sp. CCMP2097]|nr:hypothetical protein M885DRAFT_512959 [Pelagophyceae sp. CCMP2097]